MKQTDIWMPLYIADYLADTAHLTRDESGGYLHLIMAYWRNGGPLQDDDKRMAAITKSTQKEWKNLRVLMQEFFVVSDGKWTHKRIDAEMAKAQENNNKNKERAQKAAAARWGKEDSLSNATSIPRAMPDECPSPSPSPSDTNQGTKPTVQDSNSLGEPSDLGGGYSTGDLTKPMVKAGIRCNPGHPDIIALVRSGCTPGTMEAAITEAKASNQTPNQAYVVAILKRWQAEPATVGNSPRAPPRSKADERADWVRRACPSIADKPQEPNHEPTTGNTIDATAERVG